ARATYRTLIQPAIWETSVWRGTGGGRSNRWASRHAARPPTSRARTSPTATTAMRYSRRPLTMGISASRARPARSDDLAPTPWRCTDRATHARGAWILRQLSVEDDQVRLGPPNARERRGPSARVQAAV